MEFGGVAPTVLVAGAPSTAVTRRVRAQAAEPTTTRSVPKTLRRFRRSAAAHWGANFSVIHVAVTVKSGAVDSTAPIRDTSQCLSASAKAPYATNVLRQLKASIASCKPFRCLTVPGETT